MAGSRFDPEGAQRTYTSIPRGRCSQASAVTFKILVQPFNEDMDVSRDSSFNEFKHRAPADTLVVLQASHLKEVSFIAEVGDLADLNPSGAPVRTLIQVSITQKNGSDYTGKVSRFPGGSHGDEFAGYTIGQTVEFSESQILSFWHERD